jgi:hypothetical protein
MPAQPDADLFVSPSGNDAWSGTLAHLNAAGTDGPLATLAGARDRMRSLKAGGRRDYTVLLRGGTYALDRTVVFGLEDAAPDGRTVTYAAYPGERPVLSGGVRIAGWRPLADAPSALPARARGKVWVADLPPGLGLFRALFDGERLLPRARSEVFWEAKPGSHTPPPGPDDDPRCVMVFPPGKLRAWENLEDVEIGTRSVNWTVNLLGLGSVDEAKRLATTVLPSSYQIDVRRPWIWYGRKEPWAWVENVLEALSAPGQWVVNTRERKLYYWPASGTPGESIVAPRLRELVRVEGAVDAAGPADTPVKGLVFRGLAFMHGDRDVWTAADAGIQHDWEMIDKGNGLVRFRGAEQCAVEECVFTASGGCAVRLDLHCMHCRVVGNEISELGQGGIMLIGYGPGTKDVNRLNAVIDNHIHHCGLILAHSHGIVLSQSGGNRLAHNYVHDMPRKAICLTGVRVHYFQDRDRDTRECARSIRWHEVGLAREWHEIIPFLHTRDNLVEQNEIERCLGKLGDGASVNVSGAGTGNVLRRNFIHDIHGAEGEWICACVRTDDWQRGTLIAENVIARSSTAAFEHKCENRFENNVVVDVDPTNMIRFGRFWGPFERSVLARNIFVSTRQAKGKPSAVYWPLHELKDLSTSSIDDNVYHVAGSAEDRVELRRFGHDTRSIDDDPLFVDAARDDYRLQADSPARALGIVSVDVSRAGLLDPARREAARKTRDRPGPA